jgi:transcription factor E
LINKQAVPIIDLLIGKKDVNEFLIAKKLNLTINQTRKILYKLSDYGLVSFIRKKDKRKGWYIYFWTLDIYESLKLLEENFKKELADLETQLKERKEKRYYVCNTCSIEVTEETALMNDFACSECEEVYELADNTEMISQVEKNISRVQKELEVVSAERQKEEEKLEKKKTKRIKREEAARKARRKRIRKPARKQIKKHAKKQAKEKKVKKIKTNKKRIIIKAKKRRKKISR